MIREKMQNELIKTFGHEHKVVIWFCGLCEQYPENDWNDTLLGCIYVNIIEIDTFVNQLEE